MLKYTFESLEQANGKMLLAYFLFFCDFPFSFSNFAFIRIITSCLICL